MGKLALPWRFIGLLGLWISIPSYLAAEEILKQNGQVYLGMKKNDSTFITCDKSTLKIQKGDVVEPTGRKCMDPKAYKRATDDR